MRASSFVHWTRETAGAPVANEIQIHKCLENTHALYRFGVGLYNRIQRHAPWAHHVYFNFLEVAGLHYSRRRLLGTERFRAILDHVRPRVVLSTHGSLNHGFFDLAREHLGRENVRCVTYCGELFGQYGFSRHWVNPKADLFIGAVPETVAMARTLGMPKDRAVVGGFLLNPSFYHPPLSTEERTKFSPALASIRTSSPSCFPRVSTGPTTTSPSSKPSAPSVRARTFRSSPSADAIRASWTASNPGRAATPRLCPSSRCRTRT